MARKILETQKNNTYNPNALDRINITTDEEAETILVEVTELTGTIVNGVFVVSEPYTNVPFQTGTGSYPFDRSSLCDAFVHLAVHQSNLELDRDVNSDPDNNRYITYSITSGDTPLPTPVTIEVTMTDYPLVITLANGSISKGKEYLS
ncbi:MAG: hypothetical protein AAFO04_24060 [Cyanobacteria bacterium J06592_8]